MKLLDLLRDPAATSAAMAAADWNDVIEAARGAQLLGQLAAALDRAGVLARLLPAVQRQFALERLTSEHRSASAMWEVRSLRRAIAPQVPVVVLKGCAYAMAGDRNADGRIFSDVDLLVPRPSIEATEQQLITVGWKPSPHSAYDQHYYRRWMHEIPPMAHVRRSTTLDLHHTIVPIVSRFRVPDAVLLAGLQEVEPGVHVLGAFDRVIHCAVHLMQEGESRKLLRDLYDLHLLASQHAPAATEQAALLDRAAQLNLRPIVRAALAAAGALYAPARAAAPLGRRARWLVAAALGTLAPSWAARAAGTALLAHSHWMKMPMHLLLPHLAYKAVLPLLEWRKRKDAPAS